MKELIYLYYNISINKYDRHEDGIIFYNNGRDYYLCKCTYYEKYIPYYEKIVIELYNKNIEEVQIVHTNNNKSFIEYNNDLYILLKYKNINRKVSIEEIIEISNKLRVIDYKSELMKINWSQLWKEKIDFIESQLMNETTSSIIHSTIDYYIGLTENLIYMYEKTIKMYKETENDIISLSRRRVRYPNTCINYYNPIDFIFDFLVRDIAEYIKNMYFKNQRTAFEELKYTLKTLKLGQLSYNLLYIRLLYPSYYFDILEKKEEGYEEKIVKLFEKQNDYSTFIKKAYLEISKYAKIEQIPWI